MPQDMENKKRPSSLKDKRMPAVPPCLTENPFSLQSAVTLPARHAGIASWLLG